MNRKIIKMERAEDTAKIFGSFDRNARMIEVQFGVSIRNRESEAGDSIVIEGEGERAVSDAAYCRTKSAMGVFIMSSCLGEKDYLLFAASSATRIMIAHSMRFLKSSQPGLYTPAMVPVAW